MLASGDIFSNLYSEHVKSYAHQTKVGDGYSYIFIKDGKKISRLPEVIRSGKYLEELEAFFKSHPDKIGSLTPDYFYAEGITTVTKKDIYDANGDWHSYASTEKSFTVNATSILCEYIYDQPEEEVNRLLALLQQFFRVNKNSNINRAILLPDYKMSALQLALEYEQWQVANTLLEMYLHDKKRLSFLVAFYKQSIGNFIDFICSDKFKTYPEDLQKRTIANLTSFQDSSNYISNRIYRYSTNLTLMTRLLDLVMKFSPKSSFLYILKVLLSYHEYSQDKNYSLFASFININHYFYYYDETEKYKRSWTRELNDRAIHFAGVFHMLTTLSFEECKKVIYAHLETAPTGSFSSEYKRHLSKMLTLMDEGNYKSLINIFGHFRLLYEVVHPDLYEAFNPDTYPQKNAKKARSLFSLLRSTSKQSAKISESPVKPSQSTVVFEAPRADAAEAADIPAKSFSSKVITDMPAASAPSLIEDFSVNAQYVAWIEAHRFESLFTAIFHNECHPNAQYLVDGEVRDLENVILHYRDHASANERQLREAELDIIKRLVTEKLSGSLSESRLISFNNEFTEAFAAYRPLADNEADPSALGHIEAIVSREENPMHRSDAMEALEVITPPLPADSGPSVEEPCTRLREANFAGITEVIDELASPAVSEPLTANPLSLNNPSSAIILDLPATPRLGEESMPEVNLPASASGLLSQVSPELLSEREANVVDSVSHNSSVSAGGSSTSLLFTRLEALAIENGSLKAQLVAQNNALAAQNTKLQAKDAQITALLEVIRQMHFASAAINITEPPAEPASARLFSLSGISVSTTGSPSHS